MNFINKKYFFLIVLSSFSLLYSQDETAKLIIQTNVDSSGLFLDDKLTGIGKYFELSPESGVHIIQVVETLRKWDAEIIIDTIYFDLSQNISLDYNFKSKIILNTNPDDIRVYKNDSLIGFTPLLLESGFNNLKLEKPYYTSSYVTSEEISNNHLPELEYIGQPPEPQFYGSILFNILVGTAIALGAATAYYKLEADNTFDDYIITGDQELIEKVNKYDSISAGTLIAMEISVGFIFYFFLSE